MRKKSGNHPIHAGLQLSYNRGMSPRLLLKSDALESGSLLESIALSDKSYWAKVRKYVNWQTGEYIKEELAGSVIAALIVGALALIAGEATLKAASWAILALFAAFIGAVVVHFLRAHSAINAVTNRRYLSAHDELATERRHKLFLVVDTEFHLGNNWESHYSNVFIGLRVDIMGIPGAVRKEGSNPSEPVRLL